MARRNAAVLYNQLNQTLSFRFNDGRPTSATFAVYRSFVEIDDGVTPEFSGAAVLDPVNTTLAAGAGPAQSDPQLITLGSYANLAGGTRYLISQNADSEWVELVEIAASYVRARFPLRYNFTTAALFQSTTMTAAVDNSWIANISKISDLSDTYPDFRIKWTIVYAGQTVIKYSFFDVLKALVRHQVEIDDINARFPGLADSMPPEYQVDDGRPLIDAAWASVRGHLQAINIQVDAIREDEVLDELVILRALRTLAEAGIHPPGLDASSYVKLTQDNYNRFFEMHFSASLKHRLDYQIGPLTKSNAYPLLNKPYWGK